MIDTLKPGQSITCTVVHDPRTDDRKQTILRLMRRDPGVSKRLRAGQANRRRSMVSYIRGGRRWYARQRSGADARLNVGQSWTMPYTPDLANDLRSVQNYLKIDA